MRTTRISSSSAQARVRLQAIEHNLNVLRKSAGAARVMAVIKANAYGHGLISVARALASADGFGVARIDEARALRNAGINNPITVLGGIFATDFAEAAELGLRNVVHVVEQVEALEKFTGTFADAWLKIDTGMNRLGFGIEEAPGVIARLRENDTIDQLGLMTHLSSADDPKDHNDPDESETVSQVRKFSAVLDGFPGEISIANSAAILGWPELQNQFGQYRQAGRLWVRPGLALYGISPMPGKSGPGFGLEPAMRFEAPLISVKPLRAGDAVGYGQTWVATSNTTIGTIAAGYADGYSRHVRSGCPVIVNGRRVAVAGTVSMDLLAVDLGPDAVDKVGDAAILWGDELPVEEVAEHAGAIPYTLVSGVSARVSRIYE